MTPEELKDFRNLLKEMQDNHDRRSSDRPASLVIDIFVRIGVGVSTTGIVALLAFGMDMKTDMEAMKIYVEGIQKESSSFKNFMKEPRFTKDDYIQQVAPLQQMVARHEAELAQRRIFVESTNNSVRRLERDLEYIGKDLKEIKDKFKP